MSLARLLRRMKRMPEDIRKEAKRALQESADELTNMQQALAPEGPTGELKASIKQTWGTGEVKYAMGRGKGGRGRRRVKAQDPELAVEITAGNERVRYAHLVEFGTKPHEQGGWAEGTQHPGTTAQPFFYPPYRMMRRRIKSRMRRYLRRAVKKAAESS